jgi:hypothetical protein
MAAKGGVGVQRMFRILWGATKATLAATFWAVVFELAHHFGWYPEEQIAGLFVMAPTQAQLWTVFLGLVAILAIALLLAEHWVSPLIARIRNKSR